MDEFSRAMNWWGFDFEVFKFPDLGLAYVPLQRMVREVARVVEEKKLDTIISMNPFELTYGYDHPDHNRTGEVARLVSTGMPGRRGLLLWTGDGEATSTDQRLDYAAQFYPSQVISREILEKVGEKYLVIR
jgi:LmbE family N-acetylglucosaminyl deacetylase